MLNVNEIKFHHLPLYAKLCIERLQCDEALRNNHSLDELLKGYAAAYGEELDSIVIDATHRIAHERFAGSFSFLGWRKDQ